MKLSWIFIIVFASLVGCRARPIQPQESIANTYYHPYGFKISAQEWVDRGRSGRAVSHLKNGEIETVTYHEGKRHGFAEWTFPYSKLVRRSELYHQGSLRQATENYSCGAPKVQITYGDNDYQEVKAWFPDGAPQRQEQWQAGRLIQGDYTSHENVVEAQIREGSGQRVLYDAGQLAVKETYERGLLCVRETFYPNGCTATRFRYERGKQSGLAEHFDTKGEIMLTENWEGGLQHGLRSEYLEGKKIAELVYVKGQKQGIERRYRSGELVETLEWKNGKKFGPHTMYAEGQVAKTEYYYQDVPVSEITYKRLILSPNR